jgi:CRISPR-associated protein Cas2
MVFFDLPMVKPADKKRYIYFRKFLLTDGYIMLQYSIYTRICKGQEAIAKHLKRLKRNLPPEGSVKVLTLTDQQYAKMACLVGPKKPQEEKVTYEQLTLF